MAPRRRQLPTTSHLIGPKSRWKRATRYVLLLLPVRPIWSSCMALLNSTLHRERRFEFLFSLGTSLLCPRRGQQSERARENIKFAISKLSPLIRRGAPLFKHLLSVKAHQQYKRKAEEQNFRKSLEEQTHVMLDRLRARRVQEILATPLDR